MNTQDPTTATPAEIDTELADLHHRRAQAHDTLTAIAAQNHQAAGDQRIPYGRRGTVWTMTDDDAEAAVRHIATETTRSPRETTTAQQLVTRMDQANDTIAALTAQITPLNTEHQTRGGWARFFLVDQTNGHIHSSTRCSTCNHRGRPTRFTWLPSLSGKTEAEAVAEHGAKLCSTCFPQAPNEWTNHWELEEQRKAAASCSGSGTMEWIENTTRFGYVSGNGGKCSHCGGYAAATASRKIRKHKAA